MRGGLFRLTESILLKPGQTAMRLAAYKGGDNIHRWYVQNDDADQAGYPIRTSRPLATRGGGYITGGQMYRSAGAALDLDKIPSDFLTGDAFGVPGTSVFLAFKTRLDKPPEGDFRVGWSENGPYTAGVGEMIPTTTRFVPRANPAVFARPIVRRR